MMAWTNLKEKNAIVGIYKIGDPHVIVLRPWTQVDVVESLEIGVV